MMKSTAWATGNRPAFADDAIKVAAFDEFHHEEMDAAVFVGIDGGDDVGMFQSPGGLDLATESQDGLAVASEGGGQDLQGARRGRAGGGGP